MAPIQLLGFFAEWGGAGVETGYSSSSVQIIRHHFQSSPSHLVAHLLLLLSTKRWEVCGHYHQVSMKAYATRWRSRSNLTPH